MSTQARSDWLRRLDVRSARSARTSWRLAACAVIGALAGLIAALLGRPAYALAIGWDAAAAAFCLWIWLVIWPMSPADTARKARAEDPNRAISDVLTLTACVVSIAAVGIVLVAAHAAHGASADMLAGLGLLSVAVSWCTVHTIFALRYALLYYAEPEGGVDFNQQDPPCYRDFAYLALTIGATFQVSDTDLQTTQMRVTALRHSLLSYLFGAVILAATINLLASL
jgi:uncharacterized membrane protein